MIMIVGIIHDHCNRNMSNMMAGGITRRDEKNSLLLMQMGQVWYMTDADAHADGPGQPDIFSSICFSVFGTTFLES